MKQRVARSFLLLLPTLLIGGGLVLAPTLRSATMIAAKQMAMPMCSPDAAPPTKEEEAFMKENNVAMDSMMAGMNVAASGDIDRDFTRMMIPHHHGAIDMAKALLKYGKNEELKALARGIIAKQAEEIALMQRIGGGSPLSANPMEHHHVMP